MNLGVLVICGMRKVPGRKMRMFRYMYGVKLRDKLFGIELRQRLGIEDIVKVVQRNRLRWFVYVLRKDDDD